MNYRALGSSGLKVSELCLGTMQFGWTADEPESLSVLSAALDAGINFFDTADVYSRWVEGNPGGVAETILGKWVKADPGRRGKVVIATKVRGRMGDGPNDEGLSRAHIMQAVEASLRRLQIETIDLYQLHHPDGMTPIEETLTALEDLVHQGKVHYIGCSNYKAWQVVQALWTSDRLNLSSFACMQPRYNLLQRSEYEAELQSVAEAYGLGVIPYSPLAAGFLTGKYERGQPPPEGSRVSRSTRLPRLLASDQSWEALECIRRVADAHQASPSQVALAWTLKQPGITSPIIGPRSVEQLQDNLGGVDLDLSPAELTEISQVTAPAA